MKNSIICILATALLTAGCSLKEGNLFDRDPDERLNEALELYENTLISSPCGWFLDINTGARGVFRHWMSFDDKNRVTMLSDMDATYTWSNSSRDLRESSWRLKLDQAPLLIFDTNNYLHFLSEPVGSTGNGINGNGGTVNEGLVSDFEFFIEGVKNGTLVLKGRRNRCDATLTPVTAAELSVVMTGGLKNVHSKTNDYLGSRDYIVGDFDGTPVEFSISTRQVSTIYYTEDGEQVMAAAGTCSDFTSLLNAEKACSDIFVVGDLEVKGRKIVAFKYVDRTPTRSGEEGDEENDGFNAVCDDYTEIPLAFSATSQLPPPTLGLGKEFSRLSLATRLPGTESSGFVTDLNALGSVLVTTAAWKLTNDPPQSFDNIALIFMDDGTGKEIIRMEIAFWGTPASTGRRTTYTGRWDYQFTDNGDGTITIYDRHQTQNGSNNSINYERNGSAPFLNYFCYVVYSSTSGGIGTWVKDESKTKPRTFRVEWVKNKTAGSAAVTGALVPVDEDGETNPYFTQYPCVGILSK